MCNAHGHHSGCLCGWGGEGHSGRNPNGFRGFGHFVETTKQGFSLRDQTNLCCPSKCRHCGAAVYFVRHNGGSVWFDELGKPWRKHPCYDKHVRDAIENFAGWEATNYTHQELVRSAAALPDAILGIISDVLLREREVGNFVTITTQQGRKFHAYAPHHLLPYQIIGALVLVSALNETIFLLNLRMSLPFYARACKSPPEPNAIPPKIVWKDFVSGKL